VLYIIYRILYIILYNTYSAIYFIFIFICNLYSFINSTYSPIYNIYSAIYHVQYMVLYGIWSLIPYIGHSHGVATWRPSYQCLGRNLRQLIKILIFALLIDYSMKLLGYSLSFYFK
jgi:hypothetical protein